MLFIVSRVPSHVVASAILPYRASLRPHTDGDGGTLVVADRDALPCVNALQRMNAHVSAVRTPNTTNGHRDTTAYAAMSRIER